MNFEKEFQKINAKYPWASEATLIDVAEVLGKQIKDSTGLQQKFNKNKPDVVGFKSEMQGLVSKLISKGTEASKKLTSATKKFLVFGRMTSPIEGVATMTAIGASKVANLGRSVADSPKTGLLGDVGGGSLAAFGVAAAAYSAAMIFYGKLMTEQEKASRAMINQGLLVADLDMYTEMKHQFTEAGLSLNEGMELLGNTIPTFANLGDDTTLTLTNMLRSIDTAIDTNTISKFGQRRSAVTRQVSDVLTTLYDIGSINDLNQMAMAKTLDRYESNNRIIFAVSQLMGVNAESERNRRLEESRNIEFVVASRNSQASIIDRLGEIGFENLSYARSSFLSGLGYLGDEFATLAGNALNRAIYDYDTDTDFRNNIDTELNEVLNLLGPSVRESFLDIGQQLLDGDLHGIDLELAKRDFFKTIQQSNNTIATDGMFQIPDGEIQIAREVFNRSFLIGDEFMNATDQELVELAAASAALTDNADDAIEVVDALAVAMRRVYNMMMPGFGTTGLAMDYFNDNLERLIGGVDSVISVFDDEPAVSGGRNNPRRRGDRSGVTGTSEGSIPENDITVLPPAPVSRGRNNPRRRGDRAGVTGSQTDTLPNASTNNSIDVGSVSLYQGGEYGVNLTQGQNALVDLSQGNESSMVRAGAQENLDRLLSGPYARLQEYYGGPVSINDAIAKHGTTRESNTPNSQHFFGNALDLHTGAMSNEDKTRLVHAALRAGFKGFGFGGTILHVDLGSARSWSYTNTTFAGRPVSVWKSFVAGNAEAIQSVELNPLQSEFVDVEDTTSEAELVNPTTLVIPESGVDTSQQNLRSVARQRDDLYDEYWTLKRNPEDNVERITTIEHGLGKIESVYGDYISDMGADIIPRTGFQRFKMLDEELQERYEAEIENSNLIETIELINSNLEVEQRSAIQTRLAWNDIFNYGNQSRRISETI